ncbi:hypothetical protein J3Q64DRAFT_1703198 [Phycomyces blakesleeanus]|uniref:Uncharacterized protein n=2 Tax=Phycomyces blakesleeanus TaxID=4837 RepID=A0A167K8G9_PHYB8|nr:hypothetical protein PHYBLDRAFT_174175 [Phycomyces blakesleeanus NRRL 1555(-)]OAD67479.1 hypothetical protein PHYBLDRAFT_174175 [Phycomyces blakesleeanus NRRL 1555(-)]|eukprot:XP_018285519.1 hypothetical protein PHYBLDRAFT_174175 [Phycomyces blakesleeanus NRRL 1555(-)]
MNSSINIKGNQSLKAHLYFVNSIYIIPVDKSYMPIQESPSVLHILFLCFKICLRSWGHLTYTTSGGSAQHRDEGRLSIKKRSWLNALKPSASYSESWTPPELSQGPEG